jgi:hypothetical protein
MRRPDRLSRSICPSVRGRLTHAAPSLVLLVRRWCERGHPASSWRHLRRVRREEA